jgi:hypothetical protein
MQAPSRKPAKPGEVDEEAAAKKPDVMVGDDVFFNHPNGPMSGRVTAAGEHGATINANGVTHKIKWPHIVGHKRRAPQHYQITESGEDGHIVTDANGKRIFFLIPNESHEDPLMVKAKGGGKPIIGRPGLSKKVITEKSTGREVTHYVKTEKDEPKPRKKAAPEQPAAAPEAGSGAPEGSAKVGETVSFTAGDFKGQGKVTNAGAKGATVKDSSGREHKVNWDEIHSKPQYAPRNEGENDKSYAKRVVDQMPPPKNLPEDHDKYFDTKGASTVPMENLHSTKTDAENQKGGDNAPKRMEAALHGQLGKRPPITVSPHPTKPGHYNVEDGNGTFTAAKKAGWKHMPVNIKPAGAADADGNPEVKAKEIAKAVVDPADPKFADLPKKAVQPTADRDELFALSEAGLGQLKEWLNEGRGVASKLGFKTMTTGPNNVTAEEYAKPGKMLFIAGLKQAGDGIKRTTEKVEEDYDGDWSRISDLVRCTLAVDDLHDMADTMASLEASGMKVAQVPKNTFLKPTSMGYCDVNLIVTMKNGVQAEVQLNVKDMIQAKNVAHPFYEVTRKLEGKYKKTKTQAATPIEQWPEAEQKTYAEAANKQKQIYGSAWLAHVKKHYSSARKMIKSLGRVLLLFGKKPCTSNTAI